jgi:serine/threonine-protein kinase RsbW
MQTVRFPGRYSSLDAISEFVREAARAAGLGEQQVYEVDLAANEGASNIIDHAYGGEGDGVIECTCEVESNGLTITLCDWGESFDPASVDEPDFDVPLEELTLRGAGLRIIRNCMDEVDYSPNAKGGNQMRMRKNT